jgi:hypothetical protein
MKYVYMNHRIREATPKGPVIVVQGPDGTREADEFEIRVFGQSIGRVKFARTGLPACKTHDVHAWVQFEDDVELVPVAQASAKKPNKKVKVSK